jgi:DNA-binding response OmpR family regulator
MTQETVLVIEDDYETRTFLADALLRPAGYRVIEAGDGQEGLKSILVDQPNVILLDLNLPALNGLELLRQLQKQESTIPVIVLTAHGSEQEILQAFRLGAREFLQKPFGLEEVRTAIRNALAEDRLQREKEHLTRALARANRSLQRQVQAWMVLNDIAQAITSTLEEPEIFRRVLQGITRLLHVEASLLLLVNQGTGNLEYKVTLEGDEARVSRVSLKAGQGIAGWVAQHGKPLLIPDVQRDPSLLKRLDHLGDLNVRSLLCVPLRAKGQVVGVLEVLNKRSGPTSPSFTSGDEELLTMLASWVAVAVENARLNRAAQDMAATRTLKHAVTTMAHHINNRLTAFMLELDGLEQEGGSDPRRLRKWIHSARQYVHEIAAVLAALDRLDKIRTVPYAGEEELIDIEEALKEQLDRL